MTLPFRMTFRDVEIYRMLVEGANNAEIVARLGLKPSTAKKYVYRLLNKLGSRSRAKLIVDYYQGNGPFQPLVETEKGPAGRKK